MNAERTGRRYHRTGCGQPFDTPGAREREKIRVKIQQEIDMRILTRSAAFLILGCTLFVTAPAQTSSGAAEQELLVSVNRTRRAQGLPPLRWNDALAAAARRHAGVMAQRGSAEHGFAGEPGLASRVTQAGVRFVSLSENVAQGPGPEAIQAEFLNSANHRANILDSDMDSVGIGVVERRGQLFAVEDFSKVK
jgi:uncharacterized protein YkwD